MTPDVIELLRTSEETIDQERQSSSQSVKSAPNKPSSKSISPSLAPLTLSTPHTTSKPISSPPKDVNSNLKLDLNSSNEKKDNAPPEVDVLQGLNLPDSLPEIPPHLQPKTTYDLWDNISPTEKEPEPMFTSQITISSSDRSAASSISGSPRPSISEASVPEPILRKTRSSNVNFNRNSVNENQNDSGNASDLSVQSQKSARLRQNSQDSEESSKSPDNKKKWSVTIDPFSPTADVANRRRDEQVNEINR